MSGQHKRGQGRITKTRLISERGEACETRVGLLAQQGLRAITSWLFSRVSTKKAGPVADNARRRELREGPAPVELAATLA